MDAGGAAAADGTPVPVDLAASTQTAADKEKEDKPPQQKYRMNEVIRNIIWDLVCLSNDIVTLANEKRCVFSRVFHQTRLQLCS